MKKAEKMEKSKITKSSNSSSKKGISTKLGGLLNMRKKNQESNGILSSTSRNFLKSTGREMVVNNLKNSTQFPGAPEDVLTRREIKSIILKIMTKQQEKKITRNEEIENMTVKKFKEKFLKNFLADGTFGARLIWNGRELRNSHLMKEFNFDDNPQVYVFLFNIADKEYESRKITTLKTDPNLGVDFDYFVERNMISEEEAAWKRFGFHGPYIFRTKMSKISDYYLFMREIEYLRERPELKADRKNFRSHRIKDPREEYRNMTKNKKRLFFVLLFLISVIFSFPTLLLIKLALSRKMRYVVIFGNLTNLLLILIINLVFNAEVWSPLQLLFGIN